MMIFKDYSANTLLIVMVVNIVGVLCSVKNNDEQSVKAKRGASIVPYSFTAPDYLRFEGSRVKSSRLQKNGELASDSYSYSKLKGLIAAPVVPMLKTTVEYWPPDMDKEKFFNIKKDSEIQMWPHEIKKEKKITRVNQKVMPENLPDIPTKTVSVSSWAQLDYKNSFESLIGPTESSVPESVSVTDPGPVVFPTLEPTTRGPDQSVVYIARGGYKKRKLKKKAKISPFVETSPTKAPSTSTESEIKASDVYMPEATPIYEINDEPIVNIFPPVRYTDVVNNLSHLTEQSFGTSRVNESNPQIEITSNSQPIVYEDNLVVEFSLGNDSTGINETFIASNVTEESTTQISRKRLSIDDITPLEKLLNQLTQAIGERDVAKIKRIVELMEEPTTKIASNATNAAPTVEKSSLAPATMSTSIEASTAVPEKKIYLAPRIRIAQRKVKPLKESSPVDKLQDSLISTTAETVPPTSSSTKLMVTTEKIMSTFTPVHARRPGRRGGRSQGSQLNARVKVTTTRSSHAAKNVTRRIVNRNQS